jgi:hypothetical protein
LILFMLLPLVVETKVEHGNQGNFGADCISF